MEVQFFGVTFQATNQSDRKRCDWCNQLIDANKCLVHAASKHNVDSDHVRIESGVVIY